MFSKNNKKMIIQKEQEKINYYGIKKFNAGTASVLIAAGFAFLGGGSALASNDTAVNATSETENNNLVTANKEVSTTTPVKVNKTNLSAAIARVQEAIANAGVTEKTASAIEDAKAELATAKALEASEVATQAEVNKVTVELKNKAFVLESMKKATAKEEDKPTEEKVNKNQDPRNGQAIPGKGESGFRADKFIVDKSNSPQLPDTTTTGTDKFTFVALPENDSRRNNKVIAIASGQAGDIEVKGTGNAPTDLEIEMYSSQRTGQAENPVAMSTVNGQPVTSPGRMDYPLSKEQVQKLQEEAKLWRNKEKPDGNRISNNPATVFGSSGAYEFLATEIYKMGYEQGVDRAYIPNISNRFAVTDKAKEAGWKIKSISPTNLPSGLIYDKESDSIQGRVVSNVQNGVQDLRFTVEAENEKTHQIVSMEFRNLRSGWIAWQDSKPPRLEVSDDAYETQVGKNVNIDIAYKDDAGSNFSGSRRRVNYKLASGKVVDIPNQNFRQAVSGLAGYATTKQAGELDGTKTSIPGISYSLSQDGTPVETDENGDQSIYGKGKLSGTATTAGIYTVSVFAKDYNTTKKSDSTWIHSGHEVQKYITVVVKPTITVKNVHSYATTIPVTISDGASTAEITLPNGKVTKLEAKNGKWVVSAGTTNEKAVVGTELGAVGGEINIPVSQEDTKDAAIDTIKAKATTENVKATLLRNKIELQDAQGVKHTATLSEKTGHWELEDTYKEVKTPTADGGYQLTKRQVYTEVQTDGSVNYYIYSYTRTFNAQDEVVSVDSVTRDKTVLPRLNTSTPEGENTVEGGTTVVEYDAVKKEWKSSDGSNVMATKEGDFWKVETTSGFTGLVKGSKAEAEDKASILNDAPGVTSTSYTTVKGATVDLVKQASATVTITDSEDDTTTDPTKKETVVTKVTLTAPSGEVTEYTSVTDAAAVKLTETGNYTVKVDVKDSNGNKVTADSDTATGTNEGDNTAIASTTYVITVKNQATSKLYTVEDDTVTSDQLKEKINPTAVDGFTPTKNDITNIPATSGKAGQTLPTPATVTYTKGTETISVETTVDVVVLPKIEPTGVTVLKDSTGLEEVVKAKAVEAANAVPTDKLPNGVTVSVKEVKQGTVPATSTTGVQTPAKVVVEYKDANDNVVETREVEVPVTVVSSTPSKIVVFEGEKPTAEQAKAAVTPGTGGTVGTPEETALPETAGKAGATDVKVDVPVTYDNGKLTETVSVPVTVLPKASGEVEVPKGESVDKVKEVAKEKATEVATSADFKAKLPTGATVTVEDITEEVLATITAEKGTNRGIVNVPATYTVDGKTYNTTIPVTINVLGSEPKTIYTVEGTKPDAEKVKNAVTPGTGGTVNAPKETDLPATTVKAGTPNITVPTTVTYPNGIETVTIPVTVLPKATPEKVITLKDTTGENLTTAVKEKAQAALGKLTLPSGVTAELDPNQTYTVPATTSNGDKGNVPVKVQYKDATGTVVAEDTINVPVTVVSSTPSKIVVFEGDEVTAEQAKAAVTPGEDGTKGEPTTLPETSGKAGATNIKVDVPVTYDNGKLTEIVSVPVTVLPKATGEVEVPKGESVDKVKEVAKTKATEVVTSADFKGKLSTGATVTAGDITEEVLATITAEKGTRKGIVKVPVTYTVDGKTYTKDAEITVNVLGSETKPVYTVEGTKPDANKVKDAVIPGTGGTVNVPSEAGLPETTGKVGETDVTATTTVTYPNGTETVKVPVEVLPKATPEKVITLKDTTGGNLTTAVKEKAQDALGKLTLPSGVTAELVPNQDYTVPATTSNGYKDNVPVKVQYKDAKGTVVAEDTINVPVTVVSSTPSKIVVFEGEKPTAEQAKAAVTPGTDGTKGEPTTLPETAGKVGATDVKVDVPVTYDNGKLTETVSVPVTVLPKAEAEEILVAKNSDKEKAKEKVLAKAKKAIEDATFKDKLPQGATVAVDETATITVPDLTKDTEVDVPVKYTVDGQEKTTTVKVPVTVVEGVPQIVPVDENNKQPNPENSIDKTDYPQGSIFRYKTPNGQTTPIDVTTTGDKNVVVEVLDPQGNTIVEVPATVRVVESYPQFVPVDKDKKQPSADGSIDSKVFPKDTEFSYETPVDTTTPGEKEVVVVAKIGDKVIAKVPAKVMVVEPKTQYVPVDKTNKQLAASKSINPEQYPDGTTFEYKTPVDTTTPGEKDVVVVAKDGEDKLVEVPAKVKVVEGKEQLIPINATGENQPKPKDSITPSDYPEDSTFEYKVPEGQTTPYDGTTPGDKPVTVVVKDKNGKVLVEVPATIKVVEVKPKPIETPVTTTPLTQEDYTKGITIPKGGKVTKVKNIPDLTTPGEKTPVKVTITLPNGKTYIVDVPVTVTPVKEIETPVTTTPLTQEDYTKGVTIPKGGKVTKVENIPDLTTPGKKDPVKVTVELPNGKVITVEVPVNVTPVKEIETPVTKTPLTPEDYTKVIAIPEGGKVTKVENIPDLTTPGKKDPVKVTVELPNGKVITVEVPVNVTPITPIETQVTKDKLTPEDILKQIKVPEGATVKVGERPDLTTPGKKDPVKVTVELPNGKVVTVEVPVNVTPIEDIVKKQGDPITNEDVEKHIKIPTGGKVISIGDKPSTDISGERPSIPVVIELPNGIRVTINIPVIVTPKATPVVVPVGTPVTPEDVKKHIELPKGWTVTKVGEIPTTTTPGTKPVVPVEIELPDGRKITVDVPVIVTPTVRQIVVPQGTPITPDDVKGHIDLPKEPGWEFIEVGEIPATIPAGVKPSVKVKIKIPSGEIVEVDVPVLVTPKARPIVVEVGTPVTEDDVIKQIDLPEGWEIVEVGEIPTTETPGQKPSVKVKVKLPTGEIIEIEVPVTVTPKGVPTTPSTPTSPTRTENQKESVVKDTSKVLPNTGINDSSSPLAGFGLAILGLATLVRRRKQK